MFMGRYRLRARAGWYCVLIGESNVAIDPAIGGYGVADIYLGEFSPHPGHPDFTNTGRVTRPLTRTTRRASTTRTARKPTFTPAGDNPPNISPTSFLPRPELLAARKTQAYRYTP